jgi:hypothetical protein
MDAKRASSDKLRPSIRLAHQFSNMDMFSDEKCMEIVKENRIDVLMAQLHDRYDALHKMRDRSMQFTLWILGLGLGMAWLLINEVELTSTQKSVITFFLVVMGIVSCVFLRAIQRGFKANHRIAIRIETALKLYEKDFYGVPEAILPENFSRENTGWSGHFNTLYALIATVLLTLILLTWTNPCGTKSGDISIPQDHSQIQTQEVIHK